MIQIFNCGYESRHQTPLDIRRPNGGTDYMLLIIKTKAFFEQNGQIQDIVPNTVLLYKKYSYVHYGSKYSKYNDDWIHFDITEEEKLFDSFVIPFDTPIVLPSCGLLSEYTRMIVQEKLGKNIWKEQILDSLMRSLLYSLDSMVSSITSFQATHKYYQCMNKLRMELLNTPHKQWTVTHMAEQVHMSPSYFQHLYKELFGVSCMQEVIQARLKNARFYLRTTDMSIQSLALFCVYEIELHFMRQFKKYEHLTPTQYREEFRVKNS